MICGLCSVIIQEKWWVGDQSKKALSLPLNLSQGKDKGFSLCFCRFSKALTPFYDKLSLQFNLGLESLGAEKQADRKWEEGTVARQAHRQRSMRSQQRVRPGWRQVLWERDKKAGRCHETWAAAQPGRRWGRQANRLKKIGRKWYKM